MHKTKEISNFLNSQYFSEGVKITLGSIVPIVVCVYAGYIEVGTLISLGALLVGLSDTPGPASHRRLGMLSTLVFSLLAYFIIIHVNFSISLTTITIALLSFIFAMFAVFNARAATVGTMCTLIMVFNVHDELVDTNKWQYMLYIGTGGLWYMLISMSMTQIRPYRIAQQQLSESIREVADYIRLKAEFYDPKTDLDKNYLNLIDTQVKINEHQEAVRNILFRSKRSIKDTTRIGRYLTLIFLDIVDLFEQSMTTQYDYGAIKATYEKYGVLILFKQVLLKVTHEMDHIAYALNANKMPKPMYQFDDDIIRLKAALDELDEQGVNTFPLKKIIINIRGIVKYLDNIYAYGSSTTNDIPKEEIDSASQFITRDQIDWKKFRDNLSLNSSVFRHALRMAIVLSGTYLTLSLTHFNPNGIYWTLLTILVILKPGFGLTKERNVQRLIGTIIGGVIGGLIIFTIQDPTVRFVLLILFFLIAYSMFRVNYIVAVVFMTPYVLIMLSFRGMNTIEMAQERILDTFLGGMIAFLSSYVIFPNWESAQFRDNMKGLLIANYNYIAQAVQLLGGADLSITKSKLARKEVYIASANMGSTLQRMLTEPKWRQVHTSHVNRFVILSHILSSYSANLITQVNETYAELFNKEHVILLKKTLSELEKAILLLPSSAVSANFVPHSEYPTISDKPSLDDDHSNLITEQLQFLSKISGDLHKVIQDLTAQASINLEEGKAGKEG